MQQKTHQHRKCCFSSPVGRSRSMSLLWCLFCFHHDSVCRVRCRHHCTLPVICCWRLRTSIPMPSSSHPQLLATAHRGLGRCGVCHRMFGPPLKPWTMLNQKATDDTHSCRICRQKQGEEMRHVEEGGPVTPVSTCVSTSKLCEKLSWRRGPNVIRTDQFR